MGLCLSWLAIKDVSPIDGVLKAIGVQKTGNFEMVNDWNLCYSHSPNGWHLIFVNHDCLMESKIAWLRKLSVGKDIICVFVEEHVMYSSAGCFRDGEFTWFIQHDSSRSHDDIKTEGTLPGCFMRIYNEKLNAAKTDDGVDYVFEVPVEIGRMISNRNLTTLMRWALE